MKARTRSVSPWFRPPQTLAQQGFVGANPAGVDRQRAQEVELGRGQLDLSARHGHAAFAVVDGEVSQGEGFGLGPSAQRGPDARRELRRREGLDDVIGGAAAQEPWRWSRRDRTPR